MLYEFEILLRRHVVIAAESEDQARTAFDGMGPEGLSVMGDLIEGEVEELVDVRPMEDEEDTHVVVRKEA